MKNKKSDLKKLVKKTWNFLWHDDSLLSWISFLVVIFVFIKFIFFPSLALITGTILPVVIVESCSMYHDTGDFDKWWEENSEWYIDSKISKEEFSQYPLVDGFNKGDVFVINGIKKSEIEIGDTIIFADSKSSRPIIHRVVDLEPLGTKGDNNVGQFTGFSGLDETSIKESQIIGKATILRIPLVGWIKLIFFEASRAPKDRGLCE